jgi:fumarate reductase subunit D
LRSSHHDARIAPATRLRRGHAAPAVRHRARRFLELHFLALATALNSAAALDTLLAVTRQPVVAFFEWAIVVALAVHLTLGLRVLAVEFFDFRETTLVPLSICLAAVAAVGLILALNLG